MSAARYAGTPTLIASCAYTTSARHVIFSDLKKYATCAMPCGRCRTTWNGRTETENPFAGRYFSSMGTYVAGPPMSGGYTPVGTNTRVITLYCSATAKTALGAPFYRFRV